MDHQHQVRFADARKMRVYVAGPMSGMPGHNFPAFNAAAAALRAKGWHVENPADHGDVIGATWADYMHSDVRMLASCGAIHLLPGWSKSRGASLEAHIAAALGMEIQYAEGAEPALPASVHEAVAHVLAELRRALPAYGNEAIFMLHGTSLASVVTLLDLTGAAREVNAKYYLPFEAFITAGAFYFVLTLSLVGLFRWAEQRWLKPMMSR